MYITDNLEIDAQNRENGDMPTVSAVIVTHNRLDYLKLAIQSVKEQDYKQLIDIIVVDDASTDGTDKYLKSLDGIVSVLIPKEESRGGNHARNVGIENARGEYVAFLDDDDQWMPNKISAQIEELLSHPGSAIAGCRRLFRDDNGKEWEEGYRPEGVLGEQVLYMIPYSTSCLMVSKQLLDSVGRFDENLTHWQEYELEMRLLLDGREVVRPEEPFVIYRVSSSDPARLSRNLDRWETAVAYIEDKHHDEIIHASKEAQQKRKFMIALDGAKRADTLHLKKRERVFLLQAFLARPSLRGLIKFFLCKPSLHSI